MIIPITEEMVAEWYFTHPRWATILQYYERSAQLTSVSAESDAWHSNTYYEYDGIRYSLIVQRALRYYLILNEMDIPLNSLSYDTNVQLRKPNIDMKISKVDFHPYTMVEAVPRKIIA